MDGLWKKRIEILIEKHDLNAKKLSIQAGLGETFVRDMLAREGTPTLTNLNKIADRLGVTVSYLIGEEGASVPIVGKVGADSSGEILFGDSPGVLGETLIPQGAQPDSVAVEVAGHSMGWWSDGSLIYYSDRKTAPTEDMLGDIVVVGLKDGRALVKRLLRGSRRGLFDLESINGPTIRDVEVEWAADIEAIVPARQAAKIKL
ncbi:XRE family transcriptional regulator [bacterium M00.F.Ca.ET.194.01.1.1]|nr:XRE family transcriptional regulator [bacterium M00.F.Ca.ET.194.01.1.1]TGS56237.1 XRE family transcriptional regulator [bacterium M00.F.Ca.ET.179.01.1.1]TGV49142.1 XRE family transcriptional regulator [bacterium M00.F.Ca.ET.168.01.1.1]